MRFMKRIIPILLTFILVLSMATPSVGLESNSSFKPIMHDGKKWRIGYCETEPFSNYSEILFSIIQGLDEYGWLKNAKSLPYTHGQDDTKAMWQWLSENDLGEYIEFPKDAYYSMSTMKVENGKNPEDTIIDRLNSQNDIDLMIVMGTKAGIALGNDKHNVPIFVFSASNAYNSGIVKGVDYSGSNHIWAHMDVNRFKRQLQVFDDVFKFKKLGIVYENSEVGRSYSALNDIEYMAKERGFEIEREFVDEPKDDSDIERYKNDLKAAYSKLAPRIDAFYVTIASIDPKWLPELLQPIYNNKIPVFSQLGLDEVQHGALMSITYFDFPNMGRFGADTIIKKMSGVPLDKLEQSFENTPQILLNLEAAKKIGYKPSFDILLVADKIFNKIEQ